MLFTDEKDSVEKMRLKAREIQSFTKELSKRERKNIGAILKMSMNMLLFALMTILMLGIIVNMRLARHCHAY